MNTPRKRRALESLIRKQNNLCHLCGQPMKAPTAVSHPRAATFDHLVPRSKGGRDCESNGAAAHYECNQARGDLDLPLAPEFVAEMRTRPHIPARKSQLQLVGHRVRLGEFSTDKT
jgi:5-methylcytosine-specific restriction endonuclease McrA